MCLLFTQHLKPKLKIWLLLYMFDFRLKVFYTVAKRLNFTKAAYKEMLSKEAIIEALEPIIAAYALERGEGEHFGDFVIRKKVVEAHERPVKPLS